MSLCPKTGCPHYNKATKHERKCYYKPQCWKGKADVLLHTLRLGVRWQ